MKSNLNHRLPEPMRTESQFQAMAVIIALFFGYSSAAQTIDPSFTSGNEYVNQIALQSTGKIIVVNAFMDSYDGNPAKGIARLNADGTFDPTFFTTTSGFVNSGFAYDRHLLIDNADRIIIVGQFTSVHGVPRTDIVRLNSDGTVDNFNPRIHVDGPITRALINPSDNKIYISGAFTSYDGVPLSGIARLNPDGSLDTGFNPTTFNYGILAVQDDGKPLALGGPGGVVFTRLNPDGSIDPSFSPALLPPFITIFAGGLGNIARISPDNKIYFTWLQSIGEGMYPSRLSRYNADGTEDTGYTPALSVDSFGSITSLDVTGSGKVIICGNEIWSGSNNGVLRLNADGSTDNTFTSPLTVPYAADAVLQPDGNLVLAAGFPDGTRLKRLLLPQLAIQSFSPLEGYIGTTVTINGTSFDPIASNNAVELNGTPAIVKDPSNSTTLTITVPAGATSGPISVTSGGVKVTSIQDFTVTPSDCTTPPPGNACTFDGLNDVITTPVNDYANLNPSTTMEAWVYPLRINHLQTQIIVSGSRGIIIPGGTSNFGVYTGSDIWMPVEVTLNEWQHIAVVYTSDNIYFYKNGVEFVYAGTPTSNFGWWISIGGEEGSGAGFYGKIDEVRFWTTQRTSQEIIDYRCSVLAGTEPNLEAYFKLDEAGQGQGIEVLNSSTRMTGNGITFGSATTPIFNNVLTSGSCVPLSERNALIALYNATNGPNWGTENQNWLSADESTWYGIKVTNCHVEEIDLAYVNLQGSIPVALKDLVELDSLVLLSDGLTGIIPPELGQLSKLKHLLIGSSGTGNSITGTLPKEIGNLTNLIRLDLVGGHTLTGPIPEEYGNLVNLEDMTLQGGDYVNDVTSGQTGLTGNIPAGVANLPKLKYLHLPENQLSGPIPSSFSPTLEWLEIGGNQFSGNIPSSLANTNLRGLYLYRNQLTGSIPQSLGNLTNLQWINLRSNNLTGPLPTTFQNLNVRLFTVYNNHLEGKIPDSWGASMDGEFRIENNEFTSIPKFTKAFNFFGGGLKVDNNFLDFGSLELNVGKTPVYTYSPQRNLTGGTVSATSGSTLLIPFVTGGTHNSYQWYKDGSPIVGATNQQYAKANAQLADAGSYTVQVTNTLVTGLTLVSDPFIVTITACPSPPLPTPNSGCSGSTINLSASGGTAGQYRWYTVATGGTHDASQTNSTFATPALTATTSYWVAINDGSCESSRTEVIATVLPLPTAPVIQPVNPVCPGSDITLTATGGTDGEYRWYDGAAIISGEVNSTIVVTNLTFAKPFSVSLHDGTCESNKTSVTATVKNCTAPSVESTVATAFVNGIVAINLENLISDPEGDLDPESLQIIEQPQSGAAATLEGFNLNIDYSGIAFSGTDRVTVGICDLTNLCTEQAITIELGGQIKIYNAVSPNGDGKNEIFLIQHIDLLPETQRNTVTIYNRWGDEVFHTKNYNNTSNVFKGESNTGDKLPSGTYFYKIIFASGKSRTGFLELKH